MPSAPYTWDEDLHSPSVSTPTTSETLSGVHASAATLPSLADSINALAQILNEPSAVYNQPVNTQGFWNTYPGLVSGIQPSPRPTLTINDNQTGQKWLEFSQDKVSLYDKDGTAYSLDTEDLRTLFQFVKLLSGKKSTQLFEAIKQIREVTRFENLDTDENPKEEK